MNQHFKFFSLIAFLCAALFFSQKAFPALHLTLEPQARLLLGSTLYHISESETDPYYGTITVESELEFPVNVWAAGLNTELGVDFSDHFQWFLQAEIDNNFSTPSGYMKDSDWLTVFFFSQQFSYTESDTRAEILNFQSGTGLNYLFDLFSLFKVNTGGKIGYRLQYSHFDVIGIKSGWQDPGSGKVYFNDLYSGQTVLTYDVYYHILYASLIAGISYQNFIKLNLEAGFSPLTWANDRDDHVLRKKLSTGNTMGTGFLLGGNVEFTVYKGPVDIILTAGLDYWSVTTTGKQDQHFYGDDPGTTNDETGLSYTGINDRFKYSVLAITASAGVKF